MSPYFVFGLINDISILRLSFLQLLRLFSPTQISKMFWKMIEDKYIGFEGVCANEVKCFSEQLT